MELVFCSRCKYCTNSGCISDPGRDYCEHPNNKINKHNWYQKWFKTMRHPKRINKYNNCNWYKKT